MRAACVLFCALLATLELLGAAGSAYAQTGSPAPAFQASCTDLGPVALPAAGVVPVVVHYMQNSRHPDDHVESKKLSRERINRGFEPNGEFNRVWGPVGVRFAVAGFRTCTYTLGPSQDPDPRNARHDIPDPSVNFESVFLKVLGDLNTREVQTDSGKVVFRGLDLYLWWLIEGSTPGYGIRARFGQSDEDSGRTDEPAAGRPGGVWLDTKCVAGTPMAPVDSCAGLFSHEAGHFFGLCHCCLSSVLSASAQKCINYLKPAYCPGLGLSIEGGPACAGEAGSRGATNPFDQRLMSATNPFTNKDNFDLMPCEKATALEGKEKVLKFGANGISRRR